jgi:large subunit ribosomal protein L15
VKLLGTGEISKKLTVRVHGISATAREKIEAAGGTVELLREPKVKKRKHHKGKSATASAAPAAAAQDEPAAGADTEAATPEA